MCFLEDLYVDAARRGAGVGRRLMDSVREEALSESWARLYWHTREDNATARALYDSYATADGFVRYNLIFDGAAPTTGASPGFPPQLTSPPTPATRHRVFSGSPFEEKFGFCRAVRIEDRVVVSGTAPIWPDGSCPDDAGRRPT